MNTLDEKTLKESLESVEDYLNNASDEEILDTFDSVATYRGITVDEYLGLSDQSCEFIIGSESYEDSARFIETIEESAPDNFDVSANDEYYSMASAA